MSNPPLLGRELPGFIRDLLGSAPKVGEGLNSWLFRVARLLHPYRHDSDIIAVIEAATHGTHIRAGEIERTVENSETAAWRPGEPVSRTEFARSKWPKCDTARRNQIIREGPSAVELCDYSPRWFEAGEPGIVAEILEILFSTHAIPDPLVCIGESKSFFATKPLSLWLDDQNLSANALIVPSPMSKCVGVAKAGNNSEHCLDNTGDRRFVVIEFDEGSADDQAALLWHFAEYVALSLVVHSGRRSLQGWFYCEGIVETDVRRFMDYAVSLGADEKMWTRCQFARLPGGQRDNGARQNVFYFDPASMQQTEPK